MNSAQFFLVAQPTGRASVRLMINRAVYRPIRNKEIVMLYMINFVCKKPLLVFHGIV